MVPLLNFRFALTTFLVTLSSAEIHEGQRHTKTKKLYMLKFRRCH
jgi:hypothetical protein